MKRFVIGSLALVGAVSLLFMFGLVVLLVVAASAGGNPEVPQRVVLELEVDEPLPEYASESSLSNLGEDKTTVRDVVDALERAGEDARVVGLVARVNGSPGSPAVIQEMREAVKAFRAKGKKAVAYADTYGEQNNATGAYYLASAFDEVYVQPSGDVGLYGLAIETPFFRGALDKLGVRPQIGQRYEYKNAPNSYTEQTYTPAHREAYSAFLQSLFGQIVRGVAQERKLEEAVVRAAIDGGPLSADQALKAKLVDGLHYRDEVYAKVKETAGEGAQLLYLHKYLKRAGRPHTQGESKVALVYGVGGVQRGRSEDSPFSGDTAMGSETVGAALRKASEDSQVKAIVFRVDSPGGSYVASDTIRREVQRARDQGKPVIISMSSLAASGGYFVSMEADRIIAQPGTLTGSIGVYGGKMVTAGLWEKLGVNWEAVSAGRNASMNSTDQEYSAEQQAKNEAELDRIYEDFTRKAAAGRKLPLEKLQAVARGRVWTGEQALELGLVDELGGLPLALQRAKEAAGLAADAQVRVELFPRELTPAEELAALLGQRRGDNSEDSASTVRVTTLGPGLGQVRALYRLAVRMGLLTPHESTLSAQVPEVSW